MEMTHFRFRNRTEKFIFQYCKEFNNITFIIIIHLKLRSIFQANTVSLSVLLPEYCVSVLIPSNDSSLLQKTRRICLCCGCVCLCLQGFGRILLNGKNRVDGGIRNNIRFTKYVQRRPVAAAGEELDTDLHRFLKSLGFGGRRSRRRKRDGSGRCGR